MKQIIILSILLSVAVAHLCLMNPVQRGDLAGYEEPAATDCYLTTGPCGGKGMGPPVLFALAGTNFTILFQKNLDHFYAPAPGNFTISFSYDGMDFFEVGSMPDTSAPSLTYYMMTHMVGQEFIKHGVLQVAYHTNNPNTPVTFYQCADIGVYI